MVKAALVAFALLGASAANLYDDEQSMLQMPMVGRSIAIDAADSECACPGYIEQECHDNEFQGCVWTPADGSNAPWCACDPAFVPTPPLFTAPEPEPAPEPPTPPSEPEPAPEDVPEPGFEVLSNDHSGGTVGQYFNFDVATAEAALGRSLLPQQDTFSVRNDRSGEETQVLVWPNANGGSVGDGHGRKIFEAGPSDWETGDHLTLLGHGHLAGFEVLSNDHMSGVIGQFFNFDRAAAEEALGRQLSNGGNFRVKNERTGDMVTIITWNAGAPMTGSAGTAHGRLLEGAAPGQWEVGDQLTIPSLEVLSSDHSSGIEGQYFNFDWAAAVDAVGRPLQNEEEITVRNQRSGVTAPVVLWNRPNGGSIGNSHGRLSNGEAQRGDFQAGDHLTYIQE